MLKIIEIPTFHKHAGELCYGFQLHLNGKPYHSLEHSLRIILSYLSRKIVQDRLAPTALTRITHTGRF